MSHGPCRMTARRTYGHAIANGTKVFDISEHLDMRLSEQSWLLMCHC